MTRPQRFMAIGTVTAAALLAGVAVHGVNHPSRPSSSWNPREALTVRDLDVPRGDSVALLDWLATRTMPIVDGAGAARNRSQSSGRSSRTLAELSTPSASQEREQDTTGATNADKSILNRIEPSLTLSLSRMQAPLRLRLPELNPFTGPNDVDEKVTLHLDPNFAKQASQDVVESLRQQESVYSNGKLSPSTPVPAENPLDWSVSPRDLQRSSAG